MATKNLGTLTIDLIAKTGGFEQGMSRASRTADRRSKEIERRLDRIDKAFNRIRVGVLTTGVAIAGSVGVWVNSMTKSMDATLKMAQQIGTTTEALTGLRYAAQQFSSVSDQTFDMSLRRMTRRIAEAAEGSGAAKGAIEALGLSAQDLANQSVDEQFLQIADAMKGVSDQGSRLRATMAIFDTEGVPLVNALAQGRGEIERFTQEARELGVVVDTQAALAAEKFQTNIKKMSSALEGLSISIGNQVFPVLSEFVDELTKAVTETDGVARSAKNLASDTSLARWINVVGSGLAHLIDVAVFLGKALNVVVKAFRSAVADAEVAVSGIRKLQVWNWFDEEATANFKDSLSRRNQVVEEFNKSLVDIMKYDGARAAKAWASAFERANIESQYGYLGLLADAPTSSGPLTFGNGGGRKGGAAQVSELQRLIQQMEQQRAVLGMTEAQAERYRIETAKGTAADRARALAIFEQIQAWKEADKAIQQAAESSKYIAAINRELGLFQQRQDIDVAGVGMGSYQREQLEQELAIRQDYATRRRELEEAQAVESTRLNEDQYQARIQALQYAEDEQVRILKDGAARKREAEGDWINGAIKGLQDYAKEVENVAQSVQDMFTSAFREMEDVFVDFVKTGKLDFSSLIDSIISDLARLVVRQQFTGPLASMLGNAFGGEGGFNLGSLFGGGRATGGPVSAGRIYEVNEQGPELLNIGGRQMLMMGKQSGTVTPMSESGGGSVVINMNISTPDADSFRRSRNQIEREMYSSAQRALARA